MSIRVELFGIPRERAGVAETTADGKSLGELLLQLAARYPALAECCIDAGGLRPGYVANLGGERFVTDPSTPLGPGDSVLILSTDAGG